MGGGKVWERGRARGRMKGGERAWGLRIKAAVQ